LAELPTGLLTKYVNFIRTLRDRAAFLLETTPPVICQANFARYRKRMTNNQWLSHYMNLQSSFGELLAWGC